MKKLLLLAAVLALGTNLVAANPTDGAVLNVGFDDGVMYPQFSADFNAAGNGFGDITTNDEKVHNDGAVNIFRNKGDGWEDEAATLIALKVLEPIIIESEADLMYVEAVVGDGLNIGDIGFRVRGDGNAMITFTSAGPLFQLPDARMTIKGHQSGLFYATEEVLGEGSKGKAVTLTPGTDHEIEIDVYLKDVGDAGYKLGSIIAEARYE